MGGERNDLGRIAEAANSVVIDLRRAWGAADDGSVTETALAAVIEGWDTFLYERARDVIAAFLGGDPEWPWSETRPEQADRLLAALADAGLAIRSEADEGPAP
jgi:hypothetical protein